MDSWLKPRILQRGFAILFGFLAGYLSSIRGVVLKGSKFSSQGLLILRDSPGSPLDSHLGPSRQQVLLCPDSRGFSSSKLLDPSIGLSQYLETHLLLPLARLHQNKLFPLHSLNFDQILQISAAFRTFNSISISATDSSITAGWTTAVVKAKPLTKP
jgi:hypothetical protein